MEVWGKTWNRAVLLRAGGSGCPPEFPDWSSFFLRQRSRSRAVPDLALLLYYGSGSS